MKKRYNVKCRLKSFWKDRTFKEKLLFWKPFYITFYEEVLPGQKSDYENAQYEEMIIYANNPFCLTTKEKE
jgi:hypothetical protein